MNTRTRAHTSGAKRRPGRLSAVHSSSPGTEALRCAEVIRETHDTVTLVYDREPAHDYQGPASGCTIDPHQFSSLPAVHAKLMERLKRQERTAARLLDGVSAPRTPGHHHQGGGVDARASRRTRPLLSPYLVHDVRIGMPMTIAGFSGPYHLPDDITSRTDHVVHVCEGSGIVPNWSIVKAALRDHRAASTHAALLEHVVGRHHFP